VGGIPTRLSSLVAVTVIPFGEGGSDKFPIISLARSIDDTVDMSPSFGGSSFFSEFGKGESTEYCSEPDEDAFCNVVTAASNVALVDEIFRAGVGPSFVTEFELDATHVESLEAGGDRRFSPLGEFLALPGNGSHTRISIMSPTSKRRCK
jgi:hypothetical protein